MNKILISNTTKKEIKKFNKKEWKKADVEHYGKPIRWVKKDFILKATKNGVIIGVIRFNYESGVIYIKNLIVAADKRRQGVGRILMENVEKIGKKLGAHKIFLYTGAKWTAVSFYKKLGFKKIANLPKHYFKIDFVIYSKMI